MFCLPNLSSHSVKEQDPWTLDPQQDFNYPAQGFPNAAGYRKWTTLQTTRYCVFSMVEGEVKSQRVTTDNEPVRIHGIVADYDPAGGFDDEEVEQFIERTQDSEHPCAYLSRSYNGGLHVIWFFEEPIAVRGMKQAKSFLGRCVKELKLTKLHRGMDDTTTDPVRYYRYGKDWQTISNHVIPTPVVCAWLHGATKADHFKEYGDPIPLEEVAKEFEKKWPGEWPGEFKEGVRGPTVFDPHGGHTSTDSAIIRENGMQVFNMEKGFYSWGEILGHQFVQKFQQMQIGKVVENFWFDGHGYWEMLDKRFHPRKKEDVSLSLRVAYGLSNRVQKGAMCSEVDEALRSIMVNKVVDAAVPFVYNPKRKVDFNGATYLNTSNVKVVQPHPDPQQWGVNFPFTAEVIEGMLGATQLPYWLAWASRFYQGAYNGTPNSGHAVFLVGPSGVGKSFLSTVILGTLFGGHAPSGSFLTGETRFNSQLFDKGLWTVDDNVPASTHAAHQHYTGEVKKLIANNTFTAEEKYCKPGEVNWKGRLCVTANDTPKDMRMIPELDTDMQDKVMVFRAEKHNVQFKSDDENEKTVAEEAPYFARWLLDHATPASLASTARFGVKPYIHPELEKFVINNSVHAYVLDLLQIFRNDHFSKGHGKQDWRGTTTMFLKEVSQYPGASLFLKGVTAQKLGFGFRYYISKGVDGLSAYSRGWIIENV